MKRYIKTDIELNIMLNELKAKSILQFLLRVLRVTFSGFAVVAQIPGPQTLERLKPLFQALKPKPQNPWIKDLVASWWKYMGLSFRFLRGSFKGSFFPWQEEETPSSWCRTVFLKFTSIQAAEGMPKLGFGVPYFNTFFSLKGTIMKKKVYTFFSLVT